MGILAQMCNAEIFSKDQQEYMDGFYKLHHSINNHPQSSTKQQEPFIKPSRYKPEDIIDVEFEIIGQKRLEDKT